MLIVWQLWLLGVYSGVICVVFMQEKVAKLGRELCLQQEKLQRCKEMARFRFLDLAFSFSKCH